MGVGDLRWYGLVNVPVFGDLAVVEPEDVDVRAAPGAGFADHMDVQDDVVALGEHPLISQWLLG